MGRAAALAGALLAATPAWADASDDAIKHGVELRRQRRDAEALAEFRRAFSLRPTARALAQAGLAEQALSRWVEAERDVAQALASLDDPWIAEHRKTLADALEAIRSHLGSVTLSASEPDVELWLDGALVATLPHTLRAPAGPMELELRAKGREPLRRKIEVAAQRSTTESFELPPLASAPAPETSSAPTVAPAPAPSPAAHRDEPRAPSSIAPARSIWPWVTLGGAVVLVAGGATAHVVREQAASRYNDDSRCFFGGQSREERCGSDLSLAHTSGALAVVGYAGGALLGGLTAYLWLNDSPRDRAGRVQLQAGPELAQVSYGASF